MAEKSAIEWTDATFNPWRGCTKVSDGCKFCYADTLSARNPGTLGVWGPKGSRVIAAESYWREPLKWNKKAESEGVRRRVFCASLADVFEGEETMPEAAWGPVCDARIRLFELIEATPNLDWLLLTKRPENIQRLWPFGWYDEQFTWPNVWIGTSVEDQKSANERIPHLVAVPAAVRFLSCEPLMGDVTLSPVALRFPHTVGPENYWPLQNHMIDWVIVGGESGPHARPMHPDWVRLLRAQSTSAGTAFLFKQWGNWLPLVSADEASQFSRSAPIHEWNDGTWSINIDKHKAGRLLDGRTWDELPTPVLNRSQRRIDSQ